VPILSHPGLFKAWQSVKVAGTWEMRTQNLFAPRYEKYRIPFMSSGLASSYNSPFPNTLSHIPPSSASLQVTYTTIARRFSGLQKEVLTLYRQCLRSVQLKPEVSILNTSWQISHDDIDTNSTSLQENRQNWVKYIHDEFNKYRSVQRRDFATIEHLLRIGNRRYEMYKSPLIKNVH